MYPAGVGPSTQRQVRGGEGTVTRAARRAASTHTMNQLGPLLQTRQATILPGCPLGNTTMQNLMLPFMARVRRAGRS
eukprot:1186185-Amphidinium_carterae.1